MTYTRFIAMILTSTVTMFGLMYLNTFVWSHVQFSETRTYMAIYMGATMAVIMLLFMWGMYRNKASNYAILGVSVVVFAVSLFLLRSQEAGSIAPQESGLLYVVSVGPPVGRLVGLDEWLSLIHI